MNRASRSLLPLTLTLFVILLDRISKHIVASTMQLGESIPVLGNVLRWTYVHNYGMAFGMKLTGGSLLGYVSVLAVFVILFILLRTPPRNHATRWILAMILGGAVGNTYDRIVYGYVVDFIDVDLPNFIMDRWYVFNIADAAVSVGVALLVLIMLFSRDETEPLLSTAAIEGQAIENSHDTGTEQFDVHQNGFPVTATGEKKIESESGTDPSRGAQA